MRKLYPRGLRTSYYSRRRTDGECPAPITEVEWLAVVQADASLRLSDARYYDRREDDGRVTRVHGVEWVGHPLTQAEVPCFWYSGGEIHRKVPDTATIQKMIDLAVVLQARVLGDEGELFEGQMGFTFDELNALYEEHIALIGTKRESRAEPRSLWKKWWIWFRQ